MKRANITGFDYRVDREVTKSRKSWIADMTAIVKAGGKRIVENGETMVVQFLTIDKVRQPKLAFEVYAPLPKVKT